MKILVIVLLGLTTHLHCQSVTAPHNKEVSGIVVERKFPDLEWDSLGNRVILTHYDTFYTKIYYYKKQVLIQSSQAYRNVDLRGLNAQEKEMAMKNTPYQTRYSNFVYSDDGNKGLLWYSTNIKDRLVVNEDSMLATEWALDPRREDIFKNNDRTLISSKTSEDGNIIEEYTFRNKKDTTMTGSIILVFSKSKFDEIRYSMANDIEQQKKMKLIKVVAINDARYLPPTNTHIDRIEIPWELKPITITNEKELITIFEAADSALRR